MHHTEDPRLFRTCMFTTYMTDYMPAIMREINSLYDVDGLFTNAWPPLGSLPVCHCEQCRNLPPAGTIAYWDKFNERTVYLWKLYDSIAKEKKPSNFYFANLGGGIRSTADLVKLGEICEWFQCDNQGRGGDDTPIWGCALQGRVCSAVQKGKMATNVTGAWSTGTPRWRNVYKSPQEEQMWFNETLASGMVPYHHIIGGENGMGEDRRWLEPARKYFNWMARHDAHFINKRTIANIGVVMGQRTHLFYKPPRGALMPRVHGRPVLRAARRPLPLRFRARRQAGTRGPREILGAAAAQHRAAQRRAVPPVARLRGCRRLAAGHLRNQPVQRAQRAPRGFRPGRRVRHPQGRRRRRHARATPTLRASRSSTRFSMASPAPTGFPAPRIACPLAPVENPVLTVVPGLRGVSARALVSAAGRTPANPRWWCAEQGKSRLVYFPGDIERTMWRSGHTDLAGCCRTPSAGSPAPHRP